MRAPAALGRMRARADSLMQDACLIEAVTRGVLDEGTGQYTEAATTVYSGPCRLRVIQSVPDEPFAGEVTATVQRTVLSLPMAASASGAVEIGHRVTMTASTHDASVVGRVLWVRALHHQTHSTARRLQVEEATG